jgi:hypothetical protein
MDLDSNLKHKERHMSTTTMDTTLEKLALQVKERKEFLIAVLKHIEKVLREYGEIIKREEFSYHTKLKQEIEGVRGFSFYSYSGHTDCGGNDIKVWYDPSGKEKGKCVLELYFQSGYDECKVKHFDPDSDWQQKLLDMAKNTEEVLAELRRKNAAASQAEIEASKAADDAAKLKAEAMRLGLKV